MLRHFLAVVFLAACLVCIVSEHESTRIVAAALFAITFWDLLSGTRRKPGPQENPIDFAPCGKCPKPLTPAPRADAIAKYLSPIDGLDLRQEKGGK